ncbi:MAG: GntR family transcriptional regulator [Rhodobacteraceae bacterium]|nr:GntR family transcriptional regulator [Paracoccaceae bacterium]
MRVAEFLEPKEWFRADAGPRYVQLRQRLTDGVSQGVLPPGSPLPPERELAAITDFSRVTVRKAIQALAEDGIIVQRQGSGSFIASKPEHIEQRLTRLTSFSEDMAQRGKNATTRWLERGLYMPSPEETAALNLAPEDSVARIVRLRLADGEPIAIERASLPTDILPNPLIVESSLYEVLDQSGVRPVRALQKIAAINISEANAELLAVTPGNAGLNIERTSFTESGRIVEFTQSLYRGDAYNFVAELKLVKD